MNKQQALLYKNYPEGTTKKKMFDLFFMDFPSYLKKYYTSPDLSLWDKWMNNYVEPAYKVEKQKEMEKSFGYVSMDGHNFNIQNKVYQDLKNAHLPDDISKYIGFMGGNGFFEKHRISLDNWLQIKSWKNPIEKNTFPELSIEQLVQFEAGLNYLRVMLPQLPYWKR